MTSSPLLQKVDCVTVPVPDLDSGLRFYSGALGHELRWRNDDIGQAAMKLPHSDTELVVATGLSYAPAWLVTSADDAVRAFQSAGGRVVTGASEIPVGRVAVVADPFGNNLVVLDLSTGSYTTDSSGRVTGISRVQPDVRNPPLL